ncbi:acyl-CoA dehydrogenase family protein [soil metagenome]
MPSVNASPADAAKALAPLAADHAGDGDRGCTLAAPIVAALRESPIPSMLVPAALGGGERTPGEMVAALEDLAVGDGSAAWCAMVAATSGLISAYVDPVYGCEAFGPPAVAGGVYAPLGRARREGEEFVLSGRWPFASGCMHATTLMGGAIVEGEEGVRAMVFPADDAEVHETWDVTGLRGTGSHDIEVTDLRVPASHTAVLGSDRPRHEAPLYAFPPFGLLALGIAGVALGIARGSVDELVALATRKKPGGSVRTLAERPRAQAAVAEAEGLVRGGRAQIADAIEAAWGSAQSSGEIDVERRAALRLAATLATRWSVKAVDLMVEAAGGTAIYAKSPLARRFRDVHTAAAHMMVAPASLELVGRIRLGLDTDTTQL